MRLNNYISWGLCLCGLAATVNPASPQVITSERAVSDMAAVLQDRYAKPITYEDPVLTWPGDLDLRGGDQNAKWRLFPKLRTAVIPDALVPTRTAVLDANSIRSILATYNGQNSGPRFTLIESGLGFHIVPAQVYDPSGALVAASNPLDAPISIPIESRATADHLQAICAAITGSTGSKLRFSDPSMGHRPTVDVTFVPKGTESSPAEQHLYSWGTTGQITARAALIDLMGHSSTSVSWRINCQASGRPEDRFCLLFVVPVITPGSSQ